MPGWNQDWQKKYQQHRYADDTTVMAEREEELNLLIRVKEEDEKSGLKLNTEKKKKKRGTKIVASGPIISWQIEGEKVESETWPKGRQASSGVWRVDKAGCLGLWLTISAAVP